MNVQSKLTLVVLPVVCAAVGFSLGRLTSPSYAIPAVQNVGVVRSAAHPDEESTMPGRQAEVQPQELKRRLEEALRLGDPKRTEAMESILPALVRADPYAAIEFANSCEPGDAREAVILKVFALWQEADPGSALKWASQRQDGGAFLAKLCLQQAETNPAQAITAARLFHLEGDEALMNSLFSKWAIKDEVEALNWAITLPPGAERETYIGQGAVVLAASDPSQAAQVVLSQIAPGSRQEAIVTDIVKEWNRVDWNASLAWAEQIPDDNPMRPRIQAMVKASLRAPAR